MKRRIVLTAVESEWVVVVSALVYCPNRRLRTELLTPVQAAALAHVAVPQIELWLDEGKSHGATLPGRRRLTCGNSLLVFANSQRRPVADK